ncbi:thymidine phosphorylase [Sporomusaceae bacterium FL31]|nr:thymidine phosphorylase [Sporomusaceae bacterium FL31]GCE32460.1 thymidine phosphorylase [Sporomusaceae bacterium]
MEVVNCIKEYYPYNVEVAAMLASKLAESSTSIILDDPFTADVASTGGPSSLTTLVSPLYLISAGATVPKVGVPGRPAGGIDSLAQISGYKVLLTLKEVSETLATSKYAHFLADGNFVPLDGRMFRLRQQHEAQNIPTLVAASLLSKKIAVDIKYVGLDVRVAPYGNFGDDWTTATKNAELFLNTANKLSIKAFPVLTNANYPYQPYIGRTEALVALEEIFSDSANQWLRRHLNICKTIALTCVPDLKREAVVKTTLKDLRVCFEQNLIAQGTTAQEYYNTVQITRNKHFREIRAWQDGFIYYPIYEIRNAMVRWQDKYKSELVPFPDPVGLVLRKYPGEWVRKGEVIATIRVPEDNIDLALEHFSQLIAKTIAYPMGSEFEGVIGNG